MLATLICATLIAGPVLPGPPAMECRSLVVGEFDDPKLEGVGSAQDGLLITSAFREMCRRSNSVATSSVFANAKDVGQCKRFLQGSDYEPGPKFAPKSDDLLLIHYSGRGYRAPDPDHPGVLATYLMTESTKLVDGVPDPKTMLSERDLITAASNALNRGTKQVVFLIDACYSGGMHLDFDPRVTALTSSGENETSYSFTTPTRRVFGSFSYAVAERMRRFVPGTTLGEFSAAVCSAMPRSSGVRLQGEASEPAFGLDGKRQFQDLTPGLDRPNDSAWVMPLGEEEGVNKDAVFEFFAVDGVQRRSLGASSPSSAGIGSSSFKPVARLKPNEKLFGRLVSTQTKLPATMIQLGPLADTELGQAVAKQLAGTEVELAKKDAFSTLRLDYPRDSEGHILTTDAVNLWSSENSLLQRYDLERLGTDRVAELIARSAGDYYRWLGVRSLNPANPPVAAEVRLVKLSFTASADWRLAEVRQFEGCYAGKDGDIFAMAIRLRPLLPDAAPTYFVRVLDLMPDSSAQILFPARESQQERSRLAPDRRWHIPAVDGSFLDAGAGDRPNLDEEAWKKVAALRLDGMLAGSTEVFKVLVTPEVQPWEYALRLRGSEDNKRFQLTPDGLVQRHTGWAVGTATIKGTADDRTSLDPPKSTALLTIGINEYTDPQITRLSGAEIDAKGIAAIVRRQAIGDVANRVMLSPEATRSKITDALAGSLRQASEDSVAIVSYSGMGTRDGIVAHDTTIASGRAGTVGWSTFRRLIRALPSRRVVLVLDSCDTISDAVSWRNEMAAGADSGQSVLVFGFDGQATDLPQGGPLSIAFQTAIASPATDSDGDGFLSATEIRREVSRKLRDDAATGQFHGHPLTVLGGSDFIVCRAATAAPAKSAVLRWRYPQPPPDRAGSAAPPAPSTEAKLGKSYALLIGCDEYESFNRLNNPIRDIHRIGQTLKDVYGFEVRYLENPGLTKAGELKKRPGSKQIIAAINDFRDPSMFQLKPEDQVLVYYAGHGEFIVDERLGFVLPSDSIADDPKTPRDERLDDPNRLPLSDLLGSANGLKANHVMVVLDACFAGTSVQALQANPVNISLFLKPTASNSPVPSLEQFASVSAMNRWLCGQSLPPEEIARIQRRAGLRSRIVVSSGDRAVPDGIPGQGSEFAIALDQSLRKREANGFALYRTNIFPSLDDTLGAKQPTIDAPFPGSVMDGDFVFVKGGKVPDPAATGRGS